MKHSTARNLFICACVSLAGSLGASAAVAYNPGDLLLGIRLSDNVGQGAGTNYVINIGQASLYRDDAIKGNVPISGNFTADLVTIFGSDWASRSNLVWGIIGTPSNVSDVGGDPASTMYASKVQSSPGVAGTGWSVSGSSTRTAISTTISTFQSGFAGYTASANSGAAVIQQESDAFDWRSFLVAGSNLSSSVNSKDFGGFDDIEAGVGQSLSLFRVSGAGAGSFEGSFGLSSSGLTFGAVPEPASSAMAALGVLTLAFRRRRSA